MNGESLPMHNPGMAPPQVLAAITETTRPMTSLEAMLEWGRNAEPPRNIGEIITQDEYTHDVVIRWDTAWVLTFDVT